MKKLLLCLALLIGCSNLLAMEEITSTEQDSKKSNKAFYAANIAKMVIGFAVGIPFLFTTGVILSNTQKMKSEFINEPITTTLALAFFSGPVFAGFALAGDGIYRIIKHVKKNKKQNQEETPEATTTTA